MELDRHAGVPVINGLTYEHHPCQALADAQTLRERFGDLAGLRVAYLGDGNNVCVSLMIVGALTGMDVVGRLPGGLRPRPGVRGVGRRGGARARRRGARRRATRWRRSRAPGRLYTDTWVSMGDEGAEERAARGRSRRTGSTTRCSTAPAGDAVALHCLPAHHGEEITYEVLHGPRSAVWDQAENRMHAQAALLAHVLG